MANLQSGLTWYRVTDPLSPLYGCDVSGYDASVGPFDIPPDTYLNVTALRRVDVFVGDRPFQLVAPKNFNLGIMVVASQLEPSPIQEQVVELATDLPYGSFVEESSRFREGGECLHVVAYEQGHQIALLSPPREEKAGSVVVIATRLTLADIEMIDEIGTAFERNRPTDEVKLMIERLP